MLTFRYFNPLLPDEASMLHNLLSYRNHVSTFLQTIITVFYRIHAPPQINAPPPKFLDHVPEVSSQDLHA